MTDLSKNNSTISQISMQKKKKLLTIAEKYFYLRLTFLAFPFTDFTSERSFLLLLLSFGLTRFEKHSTHF
jgi:hypothetical protein